MKTYLIAVTPPLDICKKIDVYRNLYSGYTSYIIPPHVTIVPPFTLLGVQEEELVCLLEKEGAPVEGMRACLDSFGFFEERKNVLFLQPDRKSEGLFKTIFQAIFSVLDGRIKYRYDTYKANTDDFHPHLTIGEKIPDSQFEKLKAELKLVEPIIWEIFSFDIYYYNELSHSWDKLHEIALKNF